MRSLASCVPSGGKSPLHRASRGPQAAQPSDIPGRTSEQVFAARFFVAAKQKLPKYHCALEITEHRLNGLLAQSVELAPFQRAQPVQHLGERRSVRAWLLGLLPMPQNPVMPVSLRNDVWYNAGFDAQLDVELA
jgi:hypothetical protein